MSWFIKRIDHEELAMRRPALWWGTAWVDWPMHQEIVMLFPLNHFVRWLRWVRWRFLVWQNSPGRFDQHALEWASVARQEGYDMGYRHGRSEAVPDDVRREMKFEGFREGWDRAFAEMGAQIGGTDGTQA